MGKDRTITDEDAEAVAEALENRLAKRFYLNLGKGIFALIWRGIIYAGIALASYGAGSGWFKH